MRKKTAHRRTVSLGFTEERVPEGQHICYLFNDDAERNRIISQYLSSGLQANEKVLYMVDSMTPEEMLDCLEQLGVDARSKSAELTVSDAAPTYCPDGVFNCDDMLEVIGDFYSTAVEKEGYEGARGSGEMSWCLVEGRADEGALMEYEARVNLLCAEKPITACCQYDTRLFSGDVIMDVLAVHPVTIVRGQLVKNPFYIEPDRFLEERRTRATEGCA